MAREYARYLTSTHQDADWRQLTTLQHDCYMSVCSSPDITWAGVVPYFPSRYVLAADLTEKKVAKAWDELADIGMLVIDKHLGEVLVRTFVKHDNLIAKPNLAKAFTDAYAAIRSDLIRHSIARELARMAGDRPNLAGWEHIAQRQPELYAELTQLQIEG